MSISPAEPSGQEDTDASSRHARRRRSCRGFVGTAAAATGVSLLGGWAS